MALRRCLGCGGLVSSASYCRDCDAARWPSEPRSEPSGEQRERVLTAFAGRCALCRADDVPLELHHRDHDPANNEPPNLVPLCRPCHRKAERAERR